MMYDRGALMSASVISSSSEYKACSGREVLAIVSAVAVEIADMEGQNAHLSGEQVEKHKIGLSIAVQLRAQGGDVDTLLGCLRHHGYNPIDCMKILREIDGVGLDDAKVAVLQTPVWKDKAIEHDAMVERLLSDLADEETGHDG